MEYKSEILTPELLALVRENPASGLVLAINLVMERHGAIPVISKSSLDALLDVYALCLSTVRAFRLPVNMPTLALAGSVADDAKSVKDALRVLRANFQKIESTSRIAAMQYRLADELDGHEAYEFTDGDLARIQTLLNELRTFVSESKIFDESHRMRILARLERLQSELHKKVSDLDRFWGLIGDAGVAVGKFGSAAKPFVDRIRELTEIIWRAQAHREQLPSSAPNPALPPTLEDADGPPDEGQTA